MDLVVRGTETDGAVVVALLWGARRHLCGRASTLFLGCTVSAAVGPSVARISPASTRAAFFMTGASLLDRRAVSRTVIGLQSETLVLASVLLVASYAF